MLNLEFIVALCIEGLGAWVIMDSCRMGVETLSKPGPGAYPLVLGILLCALGLPLAVSAWRKLETGRTTGVGPRFSPNLGKPAIVAASLLGNALLLQLLGFPLVTFLFLFVLLSMGYTGRWVYISILSIVVVGLSYVVFTIFLQVPFPMGIFQR